jgi:hypothetical protein
MKEVTNRLMKTNRLMDEIKKLMNETTNRLGPPADSFQEMTRRQIVEDMVREQVAEHVENRLRSLAEDIVQNGPGARPQVEPPETAQDRQMLIELISSPSYVLPDLLSLVQGAQPPEILEKATDIQTELHIFQHLAFWPHWCRGKKHWYFADYHRQSVCLMHRALAR